MITSEPTEQALRAAMDGFTSSAYERDIEGTARFLAPDFQIVYMHPEKRVVDRSAWLTILPDFHTEEYTVTDEILALEGDRAVSYKFVRMRSVLRGIRRDGNFTSADYWIFRPGDGWKMWQRFSTPLTAAALPE